MAGLRAVARVAIIAIIVAVAHADVRPTYQETKDGVFFRKLGYDEPKGTLRGAYSYVLCETDAIVEPETTDDVAAAIRAYSMQAAAANQTLKVRLTQRLFHSSAAFTCPAQSVSIAPKGAANPASILSVNIVQNKLNKVLTIEKEARRMRVQPGILLWDLATAAEAQGMSVVVGTLPAFGGLTLGGTIAAGAHGSGADGTPSVPMDMVKEVVWVDAAGKRHVATPSSPEWSALFAGLGLVGVMTEFELQLNPYSHTRFESMVEMNDHNMSEVLDGLLKTHSHVLVVWRPDMQKFTVNMLTEVNASTPADKNLVTTMLTDLRYEYPMGAFNALVQEDVRDLSGALMNDMLGDVLRRLTVNRGWAGKPNGGPSGVDTWYSGVGLTNRMQTTIPCTPNCQYSGYQYKSTAYDTEFTVDYEHLKDWISDVKAIIQKDLWRGGEAKTRYLGPGYIWLRFGGERPEYLATQYGMKRPVFLQSTWLRSREAFQFPMRFGYVQDLIELIGLAKYNMSARPHWGKNTDRTFTDPRYPIRPRYPEFSKILDLQAQLDPKKVFEPPLFTKVAEQQPYARYPGCALNFQCFCTEDAHCNQPSGKQEFKCVPSAAFPEFKVCKGPADWDRILVSRYGTGAWIRHTDQAPLMRYTRAFLEPMVTDPLTKDFIRDYGQQGMAEMMRPRLPFFGPSGGLGGFPNFFGRG